MKTIKKISKVGLQLMIISFLTLCILEISYRYQWIDFYATEWKALNKSISKDRTKKVLVFGDSFSADSNSWVAKLNSLDQSTLYYNAALPGVGVETFRLISKNRISETKPSRVIIQLYVGNDLFDIEKPINWGELSIARNLFWLVGQRFRVLNFINYRAGQFTLESNSKSGKTDDSFSIEKYAARTKLYILADENYPASMVNLTGNNKHLFKELISGIKEIKNQLPSNTKLTLLVIPHCVQVHGSYRSNYKQLGALVNELDQFKSKWVNNLKNNGFEVIDPLFEFQRVENTGKSLYYKNDPHLNHQGQKVLAKFVQNSLK